MEAHPMIGGPEGQWILAGGASHRKLIHWGKPPRGAVECPSAPNRLTVSPPFNHTHFLLATPSVMATLKSKPSSTTRMTIRREYVLLNRFRRAESLSMATNTSGISFVSPNARKARMVGGCLAEYFWGAEVAFSAAPQPGDQPGRLGAAEFENQRRGPEAGGECQGTPPARDGPHGNVEGAAP